MLDFSFKSIQDCLNSDPYTNGRPYFFLDPEQLSIIEKAEKMGLVSRQSHTQASWTENGIKAIELMRKEEEKDILNHDLAKDMSKIAKEEVTAELYENGDLYLFGSELACLRIAQKNRNKETKVDFSTNLKSWFVAIYLFTEI